MKRSVYFNAVGSYVAFIATKCGVFRSDSWQLVSRSDGHAIYHHHHGAKRSAVASRRCDLPPKRTVPSQLENISHRYSCVPVDLMDPCGERSASSAPPVWWWPDAILSFATGLEDLVCWNIIIISSQCLIPNSTSSICCVFVVQLVIFLWICCTTC